MKILSVHMRMGSTLVQGLKRGCAVVWVLVGPALLLGGAVLQVLRRSSALHFFPAQMQLNMPYIVIPMHVMKMGSAVLQVLRRGCAVMQVLSRGSTVVQVLRRGCAVLHVLRRGCAVVKVLRRGSAVVHVIKMNGAVVQVLKMGNAVMQVLGRAALSCRS